MQRLVEGTEGRVGVVVVVENVAEQGVEVGAEFGVAVVGDVRGPEAQGENGVAVLPLLVEHEPLVVVEGQFGGVVLASQPAHVDDRLQVVAFQVNAQHLQPHAVACGVNLKSVACGFQQQVVALLGPRQSVEVHLRQIRVLLRHLQRLAEERHHGLHVCASLHLPCGVGPQHFNAGVALCVGVEHHAVQQVEIERVGPRGLVVGQQRELSVAVVGLGREHVAVDVERHFVVSVLVVHVAQQHAVTQVRGIFGAKVLDGAVSLLVVLHLEIRLKLRQAYLLARPFELLYAFERSDNAGVVAHLAVEPHEHHQRFGRGFAVGYLLVEQQRLAKLRLVGQKLRQRLLVEKVVRVQCDGFAQVVGALLFEQRVRVGRVLQFDDRHLVERLGGFGVNGQRLLQEFEFGIDAPHSLLPDGVEEEQAKLQTVLRPQSHSLCTVRRGGFGRHHVNRALTRGQRTKEKQRVEGK